MSMKVSTGVPQCSKLSPLIFSLYIADMPRLTELVKRVCYADELTVCAIEVKIPDLEDSINSYLGNNSVPEGQRFVDLCTKVYSHVVQPVSTPSQDPSENTH